MAAKTINATPSAYGYPLLIKQLLLTPLVHSPEREIVYANSSRYNYRGLERRIGQLANGLVSLGVEAGKTVAVMDWDSHRYLECYFAVPMMGAVLETVNIRLSPEQILYTLNHAKADVLLVNADFLPVIEGIADKFESIRAIVLLSDAETLPASPVKLDATYEDLLAAASPDYDFPDFDENTQATVFYTTGTTGDPKGVFFSHRQLVLHTLAATAALGSAAVQGRLHRDDVYMPLTPMFHVHAWGFPYIATMLGLKQVYPGPYQPDRLLKLIEREGVTFSHCVPTILHMLMHHPLINEVDLSRWKVVIGGAAMPKAMAIAAQKKGIDVFTGYGMSETCPILTLAHLPTERTDASPEEQAALRTKTGLPLPLVDLRIVDENMQSLPPDGKTTGEVVVRSPWLTQGYLNDHETSENLWRGGYLHTGDIGHIDPYGYLQITDRLKDVIKSGGEWTSSLQLEDILLQHPAVLEVAVIAQRDEKWGERPLALVRLKPEEADNVSESKLRKHVAEQVEKLGLSRYAILINIIFVESLSKTSVGKLNKRAMREEFKR
ncbi:MAG: fatty acid--CoA ligase [Betaproteobacteria bacterium]